LIAVAVDLVANIEMQKAGAQVVVDAQVAARF
jgi:hypothetical protein